MTTPAPGTTPHIQTAYLPAPEGAPTDAPRVFAVVAAVMRDAMPVGKNQRNTQQNYQFRGIDDVMSAMAGPMRTHGLFILPSIASHRQERDGKMTRTVITMRYRIYGPAGDCLLADVPGEAFDFADKATNKAQSAALKYLLFTLFMLPVDGRSIDDGDRQTPEPPEEHRAERAQRQQQRQQRRGRQQGGQQRRGDRAEQDQQQRPDYLAVARNANSREEFDKIRAAAAAAGAPADYLAQLDAVAAERAKAAQQPAGPRAVDEVTDAAGEASWQGEPAKQEAAAEHAAALGEMYDAAQAAGLTDQREADEAFGARFQTSPQQATPKQLRSMRDDLLDAANGAAA
ncbi:ERF family protein [Streptomyces aculeolatus]